MITCALCIGCSVYRPIVYQFICHRVLPSSTVDAAKWSIPLSSWGLEEQRPTHSKVRSVAKAPSDQTLVTLLQLNDRFRLSRHKRSYYYIIHL